MADNNLHHVISNRAGEKRKQMESSVSQEVSPGINTQENEEEERKSP